MTGAAPATDAAGAGPAAAGSGRPIETDALVVGAGPVGLFLVFELGLLEIGAHVVDSLAEPGGQCAELYPDKPIYDVPAVPVCSGRELTERLLAQIAPFDAPLHLDQEVSAVVRRDDGRFDVETSAGTRFVARCVFVAGGVGAFRPKPLKVAGLDAWAGTQLRHRVDDAAAFAGQRVVVVGGGVGAIDHALALAADGPPHAASVALVHRRDVWDAPADAVARLRDAVAAGAVRLVIGQPTGYTADGERLASLTVAGADGATHAIALDLLLVQLGLSPRLGPIADWGLGIERKQVVVDTERFATGVPGIYAVGDIVAYPGKRKLLVCGFHEATLAAYAAAAQLADGQPVHLQYTTTSPRLHRLLGVATPGSDGA